MNKIAKIIPLFLTALTLTSCDKLQTSIMLREVSEGVTFGTLTNGSDQFVYTGLKFEYTCQKDHYAKAKDFYISDGATKVKGTYFVLVEDGVFGNVVGEKLNLSGPETDATIITHIAFVGASISATSKAYYKGSELYLHSSKSFSIY